MESLGAMQQESFRFPGTDVDHSHIPFRWYEDDPPVGLASCPEAQSCGKQKSLHLMAQPELPLSSWQEEEKKQQEKVPIRLQSEQQPVGSFWVGIRELDQDRLDAAQPSRRGPKSWMKKKSDRENNVKFYSPCSISARGLRRGTGGPGLNGGESRGEVKGHWLGGRRMAISCCQGRSPSLGAWSRSGASCCPGTPAETRPEPRPGSHHPPSQSALQYTHTHTNITDLT